ncbi:MAG TPA: hypothetical protein VE967_13285, partial [Gemmatimonadaceae bacterium]|nr:hypothetical protein [Gemmatimonadaceae bacterium]
MKRFIYISVAGVLPPLVAAPAQQPVVPIRQVSAPTAVTPAFQSLGAVQEIAGGRLLVDASGDRQLLLFDANFGNRRVLADTTGTVAPYPRFVKLVRYLGDSLLMVDLDS